MNPMGEGYRYRSFTRAVKRHHMGRAGTTKSALRDVAALSGKLGAVRKSVLRMSTDGAWVNLMESECLRGGKAEGIPARKFPRKQLAAGRRVEMEHTNDPRIAEQIARDHMAEFKDYYPRLARMERSARRAGIKGVK